VIKKLEVLANIAVITTSLVVCTVLIRRYLLPSNRRAAVSAPTGTNPISPDPRQPSIAPGIKIVLPTVDWTKSNRTVVLALSTSCHFCAESAPFYQNLAKEKRADVRILALFPQSLQDSHSYLDKLGIKVDDVVQSPLAAIGVSGTPTLLLVDNQGVVIHSWVGRMRDADAREVASVVVK